MGKRMNRGRGEPGKGYDGDGLRLGDVAERHSAEGVMDFGLHDFDQIEDIDCPIDILIGDTTGERVKNFYEPLGWGRMYSLSCPDVYKGEPWALDNGAWAAWDGEGSQMTPDQFDHDEFLRRVAEAREAAEEMETPPIFAVVPDLLQAGETSFYQSQYWLGEIVARGWDDWNWFLAIQTGMEPSDAKFLLENYPYDGMFFGGGKALKGNARVWSRLADELDVPFHYGQCGTESRLRQAFSINEQYRVDSIDSAGPRKSGESFRKFIRNWMVMCDKFGYTT